MNYGFGTSVFPKLNIIIVTIASSLLRSIIGIALRKDKCNLSLMSAPSTKLLVLSGPYKSSCIWHEPLWFMQHFTGQTMGWMTSLCGPLR
jgi:hypothetical protein